MYTASTQIRVRYAETDQMSFVYYGNYAAYYEVARVESMRQLGFSYRELEESGIIMPVYENYSKYIAPARYDELLTIELKVKALPTSRMRFYYDIFNETGKLIHQGETVLVFVDIQTKKTCEAPAQLIEMLKPYFDEAETA